VPNSVPNSESTYFRNMALRPYPYPSLNAARNEIRLLSLAPGTSDDPIHCSLQHVSLDSTNEYIALSYTWGDPADPQQLILDNQYTLNVTVNLKDALLHLRQKDKTRRFWIDAISINQKDISERNKQVLRMRDIYARATCVEVWLGKAIDTDHHALSLVQHIGQTVPDPEDFLSKGGAVDYQVRFETCFDNSTPELIKALNDLFRRPWWTRVWIVQELSVANQLAARVTCGEASVSWLDLLVTAYAIEACWSMLNTILWQAFPDEALDGFSNGIRMAQCRHVRESQPRYHLLELLHQHRDCAATDPRDHIYGLLGMSGDADEIGLVLDYNASVQDIYKDLVVKHICATNSMDIICACRGERHFTDLPSWVPDWSTDQVIPGICITERYCGGDEFDGSPSSNVERYRTTRSSCADVSFSPSAAELITKGSTFGNVAVLSSIDDGLTFEDVESFGNSGADGKSDSGSETFDQWLNLILDDENYERLEKRYGDLVVDTFSRTLVANRNNRLMKPQAGGGENDTDGDMYESRVERADDADEDGNDNDESMSLYGEGEDENNDEKNDDDDDDDANKAFSPIHTLNMSPGEFKSCIQISWGKRLALLDTGYLGIVPGHCEVGDSVYILSGCSLPVVLRKESRSELGLELDGKKHVLIGESYFHGVTEGELMERGVHDEKKMKGIILV
jgi:hypothetical protein